MLLSKRRVSQENLPLSGVTPEEAAKLHLRWVKIFDLLGSVVTAIIIIFIVFTFVCRPVSVVGTSMLDTLNNGDWLITTNRSEYVYGDIVVVTQPNAFNEPIIKRVIATEGQKVDINYISGQVFIDDKEIYEPYIKSLTRRPGDVTFPVIVPKGCVFVMGDNRNGSTDSRSTAIGFIDTRYILGRAKFRFLPMGDFDIYDNFNG